MIFGVDNTRNAAVTPKNMATSLVLSLFFFQHPKIGEIKILLLTNIQSAGL